MVRTGIDRVEIRTAPSEKPLEPCVNAGEPVGGDVAACYRRLVRNHDREPSCLVEPRDGGGDAVEQLHALRRVEVMHFAVERPVAIEEDRRTQAAARQPLGDAGGDVTLHAIEPFGRADVLDVFGRHVAVQPAPGFEHRRKDVPRQVP